MFASKLLDILDALPSDEEPGERVVLDTPEEKSEMKEDEKGMLSHSDGHKKEDSFSFPTLDFLDPIVDASSKETLADDTKAADEESVVSDDIARRNDTEVRALTSLESDVNEVCDDAIECDMKDRDAKWNTPEFECSIIPDLIDEKKDDSVVSDAQFTSGYKFSENDAKLYSEKRAKEYDLPELVVFYKEGDKNIAKNLCRDDSGAYVSIPDDEDQQSNTSTESADTELLSSADGSKSSVEYENEKTELLVPNDPMPGSPEEVYRYENDSDDNYLEDLVMIFGSKGTAKWKHSPSAIASPNVLGVESSQQSTQPDQIPFEETASEIQNAEIVPDTELATEATVSGLNSTEPASAINLGQRVENVVEPKDVENHERRSLGDFLVYSQGYLADGEASFSRLRRGSGPAIDARHVSSFGRHSIGSDSSTASNGSFAFPLLNPGWYSSPVRMVQDVETTPHVRKQRRWKQGLLCCNF
ncbi:uncharacterized protein LOC114075608 [Solanum pennellii]|uniref:Uncharacterized protein LOC114075608 n=1 Tax=Solanum pennellii TaxID=28526 RepID=A0ABM1V275_SOLPN|nr:uncharacterized protein LOC114075608 [Solanum pennellii]XP_027769844.1 uncharacterized protein LOC114075608 [Solanum pennellii]